MTLLLDDDPGHTFVASIAGVWDPGTIAALTPESIVNATDSASEALTVNLGIYDQLDFHTLGIDSNGMQYRARWRVEATVTGPTLKIADTEPHTSEINLVLRLHPHTQRMQVVNDIYGMPYQGMLTPAVAAGLLRHRFGSSAREVAISGHGVGEFRPESLRYSDSTGAWRIEEAYGNPSDGLAGYRFVAALSPLVPTIWLRLDGTQDEQQGCQVSYCVEDANGGPTDRWDEPQPMPSFEPLGWPATEPPWVMPIG